MRLRLILSLIATVTLPASAINTAGIIASSLSAPCLEYKVVGICYWLLCTPYGCSVKTSVKVKHYIPDLVVSSYSNTGDNPWSEMAFLGMPIPIIAESGGNTNARPSNEKTQTRFKNADAIGHPSGEAFYKFLSGFGYSCSGSATAFQPYFISTLDALAWRTGLPESLYPEALIPGQREVKQTGDLWGNVFPRAGTLSQTHDYKVGAVIAQRVADIVTRAGQPHVYLPLTASHSPGYWPPESVQEGKTNNHKWQMLAPKLDSSCAIFPDRSTLDTYSDKLAADGGYAWALWRPYSCCQRRGQTFLGSTGD